MKIGVGYHNHHDAFLSGRSAASKALEQGAIVRPDVVLAFCSGDLDHDEFFKGLRSAVGESVPIVGGSAIGVITAEDLSYKGYPAAAAVIQSDTLRARVFSARELDKDEYSAGKSLGREISGTAEDRALLLFYDSVKVSPTPTTPPVLNASPPLIRGIIDAMTGAVPILGAGVIGDYGFRPTKQFCGDHVAEQSVVGILLSGAFRVSHRIIHGCTPKDGIYHTITKMEGPFVFEMDGRPIVQIIDEMYGSSQWQTQVPVRRISIGINYGQKYGEFRESDYVNRLIAGVLPGKEGIVLFEPDLQEGTEVQFMLRDADTILESARRNTLELLDEVGAGGGRPAFGLYIDCAGRAAEMSDTLKEEAAEVQSIFKERGLPLLGFYSGVEIAPFLGRSRGLDWTGVLIVISEG